MIMSQLKSAGRTILFITHKLSEAKAIADSVTVLRHGRRVSTPSDAEPVGGGDRPRHGRPRNAAASPRRPARRAASARFFAMSGVVMTTAFGRRLLDDISLSIRPGEILGVAGVDGNGQTELSEAAAGLAERSRAARSCSPAATSRGLSVRARRSARA